MYVWVHNAVGALSASGTEYRVHPPWSECIDRVHWVDGRLYHSHKVSGDVTKSMMVTNISRRRDTCCTWWYETFDLSHTWPLTLDMMTPWPELDISISIYICVSLSRHHHHDEERCERIQKKTSSEGDRLCSLKVAQTPLTTKVNRSKQLEPSVHIELKVGGEIERQTTWSIYELNWIFTKKTRKCI